MSLIECLRNWPGMGQTFLFIKGFPPGLWQRGALTPVHTGPSGTDAQCCGETKMHFCDLGSSSSCRPTINPDSTSFNPGVCWDLASAAP